VLLVGAIAALLMVLRRRNRMAPELFEPDPDGEPFDALTDKKSVK
jgi:hypothetical protein